MLPLRAPSAPLRPSLPWPCRTRPSALLAGAEVRAPAVVLEAREHAARAVVERDLDRDVADQPRPVLAHGVHVEQPHARDLLRAQRVGVPEQLVAAAHAEHERAARSGRVQTVALGLDQVLGAQALVAVLAAADVEEVVRVRVERLAQAAEASSKPIPRHAQRRSSTIRLPRSA